MVASPYPRDLVGYGRNPPDPRWPGEARIAVQVVINYEEGSEPSIQDGEGATEIGLTEAHGRGQEVRGATSRARACSNTAAGWASGV